MRVIRWQICTYAGLSIPAGFQFAFEPFENGPVFLAEQVYHLCGNTERTLQPMIADRHQMAAA